MVTGPEGRRRAVTRAASASVGNGSASFFGPHVAVGNLRVSQTECPPGYEHSKISPLSGTPGPTIPSLTDSAFEADGEELLRLDRWRTSWFTGIVACSGLDNQESDPSSPFELSPNLGDGLRDQAAAVWDCEDAGLAATS